MALSDFVDTVNAVTREFGRDKVSARLLKALIFRSVTESEYLRWGAGRVLLMPGSCAATIEELADDIAAPRTTVAMRLEYLEKAGYIEIERAKGKRFVSIIRLLFWPRLEEACLRPFVPEEERQLEVGIYLGGSSGGGEPTRLRQNVQSANTLSENPGQTSSERDERSLITGNASYPTNNTGNSGKSGDVQYTGKTYKYLQAFSIAA